METLIRPKSETKKSRISKIVLDDDTKKYKNEIKKTHKSYPLSFKKK